MRIALVHELLTMKGGAERVLRILANHFPDAPVYTLLYNEKVLGDWFPKERVKTSSLQQWTPLLGFNHHHYLPFFPRAVEAWDFSQYDLVISSSSAFAHGIITNSAPLHLCYVHSPARYLWDRTHDVLSRTPLLARIPTSLLFHRLRIWDSEAASRPDALLAASAEVARRTELYWRRGSTVLHPPIDDAWFQTLPPPPPPGIHTPYDLIVSTLVPYKRIDLVVQTYTKVNRNVVICGDGPAARSLRRLAGPTVQFVGRQEDTVLRSLYYHARCVLFPGEEDFGLVPVEAMACGTPVVAFRGGGALETVIEGQTGLFFDAPTHEDLARAVASCQGRTWDRKTCTNHAKKFCTTAFLKGIDDAIAGLMERKKTTP
jgi:glycosyltransferase involved in cell wall biosynthesis